MKLKMGMGCILVTALFFLATPSNAVSENTEPNSLTKVVHKRAKWKGVWDYTVSDVPPEYGTGVLHITKKRRKYSVKVALPHATFDAENVVVEKKNLNFTVAIEGTKATVTLVLDGDTFIGESNTDQGVFTLKGTRRK